MLPVRSYRTLAPLPVKALLKGIPFHRRYVSVALSSRSPALGVTQQVWLLGSPDFPQGWLEPRFKTVQSPQPLSQLYVCSVFEYAVDLKI